MTICPRSETPIRLPRRMGCIRQRGEDSWVAIAVLTDDEWQCACKVIGWEQARSFPPLRHGSLRASSSMSGWPGGPG